MAAVGLKQKLIGKINQTEDSGILEEMYRLIVNEETEGSIYVLLDEQRNAVEEAQQQFKNGQFLNGEQADKEIKELYCLFGIADKNPKI
jgi:hypothetical protein